jgi:hypothetical protein
MTPASLLLALRSSDPLPPEAVEAFRGLASRHYGFRGLPALWAIAEELDLSTRALRRRMVRHPELWSVLAEEVGRARDEQQADRARRRSDEAQAVDEATMKLWREWQWMSAGQVTAALAEIGRLVRVARGKR